MTDFLDTIGWYPTIGDPTLMGWFTVFAYFITFIFSLQVYVAGDYAFRRRRQLQKRLWLFITCILLFLCINKQLDLQSLLTQSGRYILRHAGLYDYRRYYQEAFILVILCAAIVLTIGLFYLYYPVIRNHRFAIVGLGFLVAFVVIRAASFHHMDHLLRTYIFGVKLNWVFELLGIAMIFINTIQLRLKIKRRRLKYGASPPAFEKRSER